MEKLRANTIFFSTALYCGVALFINYIGISDYFAIPPGREELIADMALNSPRLIMQITAYALAVLVINLLPLVVLQASLRRLALPLQRFGLSHFTVFLLAVVCLWIAALGLNKMYFPRSAFNVLLPVDDPATLHWMAYVSLAVYAALGVAPALWACTRYCIKLLRSKTARVALGGVLGLGMIQPLYSYWLTDGAPARQPDIIIIGLDSVSPLHLQHHPGALPYLEKLLADSTVFTNTITPLARTFPAWTSILTAKYPVHTGARFNLTAFDQVDTHATLSNILKSRGYTTIYAQDERKFNNLDESFGFDATVGPEPGAAEFVLTKVSDHPLSNLVLLTSWGKELFPFIAINRADSIHYDPDEFVASVIDSLPEDRSKPLFLATHFCLAHYPYTWRNQGRYGQNGAIHSIDDKHIHALGFLERQIHGLIQALKNRGRLDNAILVIMSDHGESLGYDDGYWISLKGKDHPHDVYEVNGHARFPSGSGFTGHGTDTLDHTQYQSLLAFHGFGAQKAKFAPRADARLSSLVDIMPTLLGVLNLKVPADVDGVDLLAAPAAPNTRTVPAETGIRFLAMASLASMNEDALLKESQDYYTVDHDSARLILKPSRYAELIKTKDLAIHTEDWMLALLRNDLNPVFPRQAVLVYKPTGAWTAGKDMALIGRAPMRALTAGLQRIYGAELADFAGQWPFTARPGSLSVDATITASTGQAM